MSFSILNSFNLLRTLSSKVFQISSSSMHTLSNNTALTRNTLSGGNSLCLIPVRTNIRCHFPRPNERMRIKKHGYKKRLSTQSGLRVLLRRVLKGRHVLSH